MTRGVLKRLNCPATLLVLGWGVLGCSSPENIEVAVDSPTSIKQGERFAISVSVRNTGRSEQTLVDLDIADEFLKGVVIEGSDPPFSESEHIPLDNTISYSYDLAIPPGREISITLSAYAAYQGDYSGEFDFCINSMVSCVFYTVRTIVE